MDRVTVDELLAAMIASQADVSDLIFIAGKPPLVESHGRLHDFPIDTAGGLLSSEVVEKISDHIIGNDKRLLGTLEMTGSCDTSYAIEGLVRMRVNVYQQNTGRGIVMRRFPSETPNLKTLGLPPVFREIIHEKNGIVLVTGAAGSGKTTTLAAMVNELNNTEPIHILTLEDPIEFVHPAAKAAISQRELGRDFSSFAEGLRVALRQAPKVILLGEIRDRETMEIALTAAETGHLVFSTLHTINAGQSINRIIGFFAREEEEQVRYRLSDTLRFVVSQRLVSKINGGRLLITEVIGNGLRTRESIRYGESEGKTFHEIIEAASTRGWHSFDQCLFKAFEAGQITEDTACLYCNDKGKMRRQLDSVAKTTKMAVESCSGLKLDVIAPPKVAAAAAAEAAQRAAEQAALTSS